MFNQFFLKENIEKKPFVRRFRILITAVITSEQRKRIEQI